MYNARVPLSRSTVYGLLSPWLTRLAERTERRTSTRTPEGTFWIALKTGPMKSQLNALIESHMCEE